MSEEEIRRLSFSFFIKSGAQLLLWTLISWFIADAMQTTHTRELIRAESGSLESLVSNTAQSIDLGLDYLHGIPALVAKDELIAPAMSPSGRFEVRLPQRPRSASGSSAHGFRGIQVLACTIPP